MESLQNCVAVHSTNMNPTPFHITPSEREEFAENAKWVLVLVSSERSFCRNCSPFCPGTSQRETAAKAAATNEKSMQIMNFIKWVEANTHLLLSIPFCVPMRLTNNISVGDMHAYRLCSVHDAHGHGKCVEIIYFWMPDHTKLIKIITDLLDNDRLPHTHIELSRKCKQQLRCKLHYSHCAAALRRVLCVWHMRLNRITDESDNESRWCDYCVNNCRACRYCFDSIEKHTILNLISRLLWINAVRLPRPTQNRTSIVLWHTFCWHCRE